MILDNITDNSVLVCSKQQKSEMAKVYFEKVSCIFAMHTFDCMNVKVYLVPLLFSFLQHFDCPLIPLIPLQKFLKFITRFIRQRRRQILKFDWVCVS